MKNLNLLLSKIKTKNIILFIFIILFLFIFFNSKKKENFNQNEKKITKYNLADAAKFDSDNDIDLFQFYPHQINIFRQKEAASGAPLNLGTIKDVSFFDNITVKDLLILHNDGSLKLTLVKINNSVNNKPNNLYQSDGTPAKSITIMNVNDRKSVPKMEKSADYEEISENIDKINYCFYQQVSGINNVNLNLLAVAGISKETGKIYLSCSSSSNISLPMINKFKEIHNLGKLQGINSICVFIDKVKVEKNKQNKFTKEFTIRIIVCIKKGGENTCHITDPITHEIVGDQITSLGEKSGVNMNKFQYYDSNNKLVDIKYKQIIVNSYNLEKQKEEAGKPIYFYNKQPAFAVDNDGFVFLTVPIGETTINNNNFFTVHKHLSKWSKIKNLSGEQGVEINSISDYYVDNINQIASKLYYQANLDGIAKDGRCISVNIKEYDTSANRNNIDIFYLTPEENNVKIFNNISNSYNHPIVYISNINDNRFKINKNTLFCVKDMTKEGENENLALCLIKPGDITPCSKVSNEKCKSNNYIHGVNQIIETDDNEKLKLRGQECKFSENNFYDFPLFKDNKTLRQKMNLIVNNDGIPDESVQQLKQSNDGVSLYFGDVTDGIDINNVNYPEEYGTVSEILEKQWVKFIKTSQLPRANKKNSKEIDYEKKSYPYLEKIEKDGISVELHKRGTNNNNSILDLDDEGKLLPCQVDTVVRWAARTFIDHMANNLVIGMTSEDGDSSTGRIMTELQNMANQIKESNQENKKTAQKIIERTNDAAAVAAALPSVGAAACTQDTTFKKSLCRLGINDKAARKSLDCPGEEDDFEEYWLQKLQNCDKIP